MLRRKEMTYAAPLARSQSPDDHIPDAVAVEISCGARFGTAGIVEDSSQKREPIAPSPCGGSNSAA